MEAKWKRSWLAGDKVVPETPKRSEGYIPRKGLSSRNNPEFSAPLISLRYGSLTTFGIKKKREKEKPQPESPHVLSNVRAASDAEPVSRILSGGFPSGRLFPCSAWGLPCPAHYCAGGALLPHLFTLTPPFLSTFACTAKAQQNGGAVYSLWHFPSDRLEPAFPDVIRHTALRSSDFPLSISCKPGETPLFRRRQQPSGPASTTSIIDAPGRIAGAKLWCMVCKKAYPPLDWAGKLP